MSGAAAYVRQQELRYRAYFDRIPFPMRFMTPVPCQGGVGAQRKSELAQDVLVKYAREQFGPAICGGAGVVFGGKLGWLCGGGGLVAVFVFGARRRGPGHDEVAQGGRGGEDAVVGELVLARVGALWLRGAR